jgi:hypothetical protein
MFRLAMPSQEQLKLYAKYEGRARRNLFLAGRRPGPGRFASLAWSFRFAFRVVSRRMPDSPLSHAWPFIELLAMQPGNARTIRILWAWVCYNSIDLPRLGKGKLFLFKVHDLWYNDPKRDKPNTKSLFVRKTCVVFITRVIDVKATHGAAAIDMRPKQGLHLCSRDYPFRMTQRTW